MIGKAINPGILVWIQARQQYQASFVKEMMCGYGLNEGKGRGCFPIKEHLVGRNALKFYY